MQHWRLIPGRYRLTLRTAGDPSAKIVDQTIAFHHRGDDIPIVVPPRRETLVEIDQLETYAWDLATLPDLAAAPEPKGLAGDRIVWTVHNLGAAPARSVVVEFLVPGLPPATRTIGNTPPVQDYKVGSATVSFPVPDGNQPLTLILDPANKIAEITERNNRIHVGSPVTD
ncbi:MAG: CARDB domain-containing protein [Planctomycetota bacterium]|jgi:hypothetical protein